MALKTHGGFTAVTGQPYAIQTDRTVTEKRDGTLEGSISFICDVADKDALPTFGDLHIDDDRLELFNAQTTYNGLELVTLTASYFGISASEASGGPAQVISFSGGSNNEPIETHPEFQALAGPPDTPQNGAVFDPITGQFLRFAGVDAGNLTGVQYYLTPSTVITVSFWKSSVPTLKPRMKIVDELKGVSLPSDVKNLLRIESSYRQTGSSYQVTEQYLASGPEGWNARIYP